MASCGCRFPTALRASGGPSTSTLGLMDMFEQDLRVTEINSTHTGGSTMILELCGEDEAFWIITTATSSEEGDYGCLYYDDAHQMSREEELVLLEVLEAYVSNTPLEKVTDGVAFVINLIKSKGQ